MDTLRGIEGLPPGLGRKVGVVALAVLLAAGIAFSAVRQRGARAQEEAAAVSHARLVTDTILAPELTPEDMAGPVEGDRYGQLATLVTSRILTTETIGVTILNPDATVVFSNDAALIGQDLIERQEQLRPVLEGSITTGVVDSATGQAFVTSVPLRLKGEGAPAGIAEISQSYAAILATASRPWRTVEIAFAGALLLCLIAMPLAFRSPVKKAQEDERGPEPAGGGYHDDGGLRQAQERARQADAAYRAVAEQLKQAQDRLRELELGHGSAPDDVRIAEERARESEQRARSTEAALRAARERLAKLEERLQAAGSAPVQASPQAGGEDPELRERLRDAEGEFQRALDQLRVAESVKQSLVDQARRAEERAVEAERRARELEAAYAAHADPVDAAEQQPGDGPRVADLERRLAEADAERQRHEEELAQEHERLVEAEERAALSETAYQSVAEELKEMQRRPAPGDEIRAVEHRALKAEEGLRAAEEQARQAEDRLLAAQQHGEQREALLAHSESKHAALQDRLRQAAEASPETDEPLRKAEERIRELEEQVRTAETQLVVSVGASGNGDPDADAHGPDEPVVLEGREALQAAVASEIRGPLTSILGLTLSLKHTDPSSPEGKELVRQLGINAKKLDRLVADLIDVDRLATGTLVPNRRRTDLEALVRRVVDEVKHLSDRQVTVQTDRAVAAVDPARAEQMVEALLANAGRRTSPGASVWVRVGTDQDGVVIAVDDEAPEVPADLRRAIFETTQDGPDAATPNPKGSTGLTFLSRLAEIHGGRAWVEERPGGGASFRVFLPDAPVEIDEAAQEDRGVAASA